MTILFTIDIGAYNPKYVLAATYAEARNKMLDEAPGSDPTLVDAYLVYEFEEFFRLFSPVENGDQAEDRSRYFFSASRPGQVREVVRHLRGGFYRNMWTVVVDWRGLSWVLPGIRENARGYFITKLPWISGVVDQLSLLY